MELLKTIGNLIKEMHIERTTNGLTPKWYELKALKEELNNKARSIIDDNYKDILKEEQQNEQLQNEVVPYETIEEEENTSHSIYENQEGQRFYVDMREEGEDEITLYTLENNKLVELKMIYLYELESFYCHIGYIDLWHCEVVPSGTTKQSMETIEPLLSLGDDITTQVFTSDHTSAPMFMTNQLKKMIDTILYENDTDNLGTCKIAVYDHVDENKNPIYGIHVLENDYMIEFDKNTQAVTKIYENEFGFECGLSLATRDYIFNPLMKIIADEIETIYNGLER